MIGWLQGHLAERWAQGSRCGLLLVCGGVGYELQVTRRHWDALPAEGANLALHVHQVIREDSWTLYGFSGRGERDLFRELVAVSGVGPQMAIGLLGQLREQELMRAIVQADLRLLCQAPGVGKRTAERLSVELRSRLQERLSEGPGGESSAGTATRAVPAEALTPLSPAEATRQELQETLEALGYEPLEINRAVRAVAAAGGLQEGDGEGWLRECLRWLARGQAA